jgi:thiamine-monophosphate kinase
MIDISDGLLQDLGHVCKASGVGAAIWEDKLPLSQAYRAVAGDTTFALAGGEDYELLFCARRRDRGRIEELQKRVNATITRIGQCVSFREGITVIGPGGKARRIRQRGHDHFQKQPDDQKNFSIVPAKPRHLSRDRASMGTAKLGVDGRYTDRAG